MSHQIILASQGVLVVLRLKNSSLTSEAGGLNPVTDPMLESW